MFFTIVTICNSVNHCVKGPKMLTGNGTGTKAGTKNMTGPGLRPGPEIWRDRDRDQGPGPVLVRDRDRDHGQEQDND